METIILIFHVLAAAGVIGLILLQQGKGAETGASFGAGASQTVFGSSGSASFLSRTTAILATIFFVTSFSLAIVARQKANTISDAGVPAAAVQQQQAPQTSDAPVAIESTAGGVESDAPVLDSTPVETDEMGQDQTNDLPPVQ
ncbi:preprotein translocase subunit SecG [Endozoicomonas euniceicola]|uniref:Protein-export membrane protein SecG n=1 Tax=Endozoicomonas euniceicola TaxID=1234143 RepID=A0ABY6GN84_9GAMM|nr:preprotein translocase subunit SecG [Endozoicomonas euniceicola]UYM14195.1 preprotein translocase subunit SecG [Endozoicomonas euniceicola]